jgi:hypothetical protein
MNRSSRPARPTRPPTERTPGCDRGGHGHRWPPRGDRGVSAPRGRRRGLRLVGSGAA